MSWWDEDWKTFRRMRKHRLGFINEALKHLLLARTYLEAYYSPLRRYHVIDDLNQIIRKVEDEIRDAVEEMEMEMESGAVERQVSPRGRRR